MYMTLTASENDIEVSAQINASGIVAWAVWEAEQWMPKNGSQAQNPSPNQIINCLGSPGLKACGNSATDCRFCGLKASEHGSFF